MKNIFAPLAVIVSLMVSSGCYTVKYVMSPNASGKIEEAVWPAPPKEGGSKVTFMVGGKPQNAAVDLAMYCGGKIAELSTSKTFMGGEKVAINCEGPPGSGVKAPGAKGGKKKVKKKAS